MDAIASLLGDLIALPTVNPMGRPCSRNTPIERPVIEYLEQRFARYDVPLERQPCSPIHESLLVTVPGHAREPGTLIESHIDTVPADDWPDRAFRPRHEGNVVFGRGACDDKGSLAAMVAALQTILESGERPQQTIWFLAAGDEEYGQTGIRHFLQTQDLPIGRAIFGEPTDCVPIVQHKGTIRWDLTVHGRSAHTSQPALGHNAILDA
ncbi:MAG: M20/M25/M40 family metallo-hydrolase, partial [Pirellulales bacterium]|nr:M20/M25/M40 family metallo-hydrolase [Pirellulales bacterium]